MHAFIHTNMHACLMSLSFSKAVTIESFYGDNGEQKEEESDMDLASLVKQRRVKAAKAAEEKKQKEREEAKR